MYLYIARPITVLRNSLLSKHTQKDQNTGKSRQGELSFPHRSWLEAPGKEQSVLRKFTRAINTGCKTPEAIDLRLRYSAAAVTHQ